MLEHTSINTDSGLYCFKLSDATNEFMDEVHDKLGVHCKNVLIRYTQALYATLLANYGTGFKMIVEEQGLVDSQTNQVGRNRYLIYPAPCDSGFIPAHEVINLFVRPKMTARLKENMQFLWRVLPEHFIMPSVYNPDKPEWTSELATSLVITLYPYSDHESVIKLASNKLQHR